MIEYLLIEGVNDRAEDAEKLSKLLAVRPLCYVNLIPYNETGNRYSQTPGVGIKKFASILEKYKTKFTIRHSFGSSIDAACGQLAGKTKKPKLSFY
jgi:23S rRNA (adenine2503-C2)-methyltransferase